MATPTRLRQPQIDDFRELTESAPGTPMGTLLRKFWQPVALSKELPPGAAIGVRIMNEDLTLYRGASGQPYLVAQRCAHRGTDLRTGWIEGERIRCFYHGWKYDGTGQCIEQPAEQGGFAPKVRITSYPAREYAGLVLAYLGEGAPPATPRWPELERGYGVQWNVKQIWPCNWFQRVENSMDGVHVSFVHREAPFGQAVTPVVPRLEYEETSFGLIQRAYRGAGNMRESHWQFPNCNHVVVPRADDAWNQVWADNFGWKVPVDDEHTVEFLITDVPVTGEAEQKLRRWVDQYSQYDPAQHHDELLRGTMPEQKSWMIPAQDYLAQVFQGTIADRSSEHLGKSDAGVILMRKIFRRELDAIKNGLPTKQWQPEAGYARLPVPPGVAPVSAAS